MYTPSLFGTKNATEQYKEGKNHGNSRFYPPDIVTMLPNRLGGVHFIRPRTNIPRERPQSAESEDVGSDGRAVIKPDGRTDGPGQERGRPWSEEGPGRSAKGCNPVNRFKKVRKNKKRVKNKTSI